MRRYTSLLFYFIFWSVSLSDCEEEGDLRLVDGRDRSEGRVEVFHDGAWGTICDDDWDINDAHVVCRQLHFSGAIRALGSSPYGGGRGDILIDGTRCIGTEIKLHHCEFNGWNIHDCKHTEDAGVICRKESFDIQGSTEEYDFDQNKGLSEQLGELFDSGRDCDVNITVMAGDVTPEMICAHRVILALNSDLRVCQPDLSSLSINVASDCSKHANSFIRYFYTRKLEVTLPSALCILRMAYDWGLTALQNESVNIIKPFLTGDSVFQGEVYDYAVFAGDEALQEVYVRYLAWNCEALIHSPAWTNLPLDLVRALLSRSDLVVHNETDILNGLNRWKVARGNASIPEDLLKLIRFPMIPAEDLNTLNGSEYQTGKLQGFQFNALPRSALLNEMVKEQTTYTSRIYTSSPWSFTFIHYISKSSEDLLSLNGDQSFTILTSDFQTPVHNSAYFIFNNIHWKARLYITEESCKNDSVNCASLPAVSLKIEKNDTDIPFEVRQGITYSNRLVVMCESRYVVLVADLNHIDDSVFAPVSTEQAFPCRSNLLSYQVVVRPLYT